MVSWALLELYYSKGSPLTFTTYVKNPRHASQSISEQPLLLTVAVPRPLRQLYHYLPPPNAKPQQLQVGVRLKVPFGKTQVIGFLMALEKKPQPKGIALKHALTVLDDEPVLESSILDVLLWAHRYYHHPLGDVLTNALPQRLRQGHSAQLSTRILWQCTEQGKRYDINQLQRAPRQQQALVFLLENNPCSPQILTQQGITSTTLSALAAKGLVEKKEWDFVPSCQAKPKLGPSLHPEQQQAITTILSKQHQFQCFLLYGITGSGKTEVYLSLIETVIAAGEQALVLVPEIGLTPQTVQRFKNRFAVPLVAIHSELSDRERLDAWVLAKTNQAKIIIGTRSAIFTPIPKLGIIIIDEEHDASFKQQEGFRYHARDLAILRAQQQKIPIVLGSATPSLETIANVTNKGFQQINLTHRAGGAQCPPIKILDIRNQRLQHGLSTALIGIIRDHLQRQGQVLLFINRRGYAPNLICHQCGWVAKCSHCDARLTLHQQPQRLLCHHCGQQQRLRERCEHCQSKSLIFLGQGTERIESALHHHFPKTPILRIDRDSTRLKGSFQQIIATIHQGDPCILVGTQMLAKGHHFPQVTLAAIIDADAGLFSTDFRASERLGQLIVQVAGRAGRAQQKGEVFLQTRMPHHPLLQTLIQKDYLAFAHCLLQERLQTQCPPAAHFALFRAQASDQSSGLTFLNQVKQLSENTAYTPKLLGPIPAPMPKKAGRFRSQLLLQANQRKALQQHLQLLIQALDGLPITTKVRWSLDVDPIDLF